MKPLFLLILLLGLLLFNNVAHAEGGCPAGMIPYSGNDLNSCGPVPADYYGNQQQGQQQTQARAPEARWATRWGAIATDYIKGTLGSITGLASKVDAEQAALADCRNKGGSPCKVEIAYDNECAAMILGSNGYNVGADATADKAIGLGMKICTDAKDTNCHVYFSACSLPVKIQ